MTTVIGFVLVSVGRGPLSGLLEQWWVTVDAAGDGIATTRARLSVQWSPWSSSFIVDPEAAEIIGSSREGAPLGRADLVAEFLRSAEFARSLDSIRHVAHRYRRQLPERVAAITSTR